MTTAVLERKPHAATGEANPGLRLMVLARIACDEGATRPELARELGAYVGVGPVARMPIEAELAQLVRAGHAIESRSRFTASPEGLERLHLELNIKALPKTWAELRDIRLVGKALGIERDAASRLKGLADPDVLRAEVLIRFYGLGLKGSSSSIKLRTALAVTALERAFGNRIKSELSTSTGLNAKASRVLAGQLLRKPRDAGTDKRLVAMLAAEAVDSPKLDIDQLRAGILKRYATGGCPVAPAARLEPAASRPETVVPPAAPNKPAPAAPSAASTASAQRPSAANRPDLPGFVKVVQAAATAHAEGWPGNRKALVSRVYTAISAEHSGWGLSLVEFKAMLAECHRIGKLALVTADLKDKRLLDELKLSAITYKNTVWHLVRVE
jgi:hypothetical protein